MSRTILLIVILLISALNSFSQKPRYITVIAENANLRGAPSASSNLVALVQEGETFRLIEVRGAWYLVETPDYVGWLHGNTIRFGKNEIDDITPPRYVRSEPRKVIGKQPKAVKVEPPPQVETIRPNSGTVMAAGSYRTGLGDLTISNGTDTDAIAKLIDLRVGASYREVYIQANSSSTIQNIAIGNYELLFSLGQNYAPSLSKFLTNASYSKFDSNISFTETKEDLGNTIRTNYDSYRLTLNKVVGGNAATSRISEAEFTKY